MTVEAWTLKIVNALRQNLVAQSDRSSATPLSRLSDSLNALTPSSQDTDEALTALIRLIENKAEGFEGEAEKKYWRGLTLLCRNVQTHNKERIASTFYARLFGPDALQNSLRVFALNGTVAAGRKLTRIELERLKDVLKSHPIPWINAAIYGSHFDVAVGEASSLLKNDALDINAFALCLNGWRKCWDNSSSRFNDAVMTFKESACTEMAKRKLQEWMDRRGIQPSTETAGKVRRPAFQRIIPEEMMDAVLAA